MTTMRTMISRSSNNRSLLMLALVMLAACIPRMVVGGGIFEAVKPILPSPNDYKLTFKPSGPVPMEKPPVVLITASSPFNGTILQINLVTMEPCGVVGAHFHPRGTEHVFVIKGKVEIGLFFEDRSTKFVTVSAGEGAILPQGTVHYVRNVGCTKAQFTATFDHPAAGAVFVGEALLSFPEHFLKAQFSGEVVEGPAPRLFFHHKCHCKSHHG